MTVLPLKVIRPFNGSKDHPRGLGPRWRTPADYEHALFEDLDAGAAKGFRYFTLHAPAGHPPDLPYGLHHWEWLDPTINGMFVHRLPEWLDAQPNAVYLAPYLTFAVPPRRTDYPFEEMFVPSFNKPFVPNEVWAAITPWFALHPNIGVGFDASMQDDRRAEFLQWVASLRAMGRWVFGEAIPGTPIAPHPDALKVPCWMLWRTYVNRDPQRRWRVPATLGSRIAFHKADQATLADMKDLVARGFGLASFHNDKDDLVLQASGV